MRSERSYEIHNEDGELRVSLETVSLENEIETLRVRVSFEREKIPGIIRIEWAEAMVNTLFVWIPGQSDRNMHQSWVNLKAIPLSAAGRPC